MPPDEGLTAALEAFAQLIDERADTLRAMGEKPHMMGSALRHGVEACHAAVRGGDLKEIAAAEADASRVLKETAERLVATVIAALRRLREGLP